MKTTKRQFKLFCDEFKAQVERMGLMEWRLDLLHEEEAEGCFVSLSGSYENRVVAVRFNIETKRPLTDEFILETAKHEAIELLVDDAFTIATSRYLTHDEIVSTRHTLVRRLEKLLRWI